MTTEQVVPKVINALTMTWERLESRVGHTQRVRIKRIQALLAMEILEKSKEINPPEIPHYTFDFRPDIPETIREGYDTIWQYLAVSFPFDDDLILIKRPSNCDRWTGFRARSAIIRQGFTALRKAMDIDWCKYPIYMVPRRSQNKRVVRGREIKTTPNDFEVITVHGDYKVNDAETAVEIYQARNNCDIKNHMRRHVEKAEAAGGTEARRQAEEWLLNCVQEEKSRLRQPMLSFGDDQAQLPAPAAIC